MDQARPKPAISRLERWSVQKRIARLVRLLPENLVYFDRNARILEVSDRALDAFGYRRNEVVGHYVSEFLAPDTLDEHHAKQSDFWREVGHAMDTRIRRKNGAIANVRADVVIDLSRDGFPAGAIALLEVVWNGPRFTTGFRGWRTESPYGLTPRELTVLEAVATGQTSKQIAQALKISSLTVHKHIGHILAKMGSPSRTEACVRAIQEGWLPGPMKTA